MSQQLFTQVISSAALIPEGSAFVGFRQTSGEDIKVTRMLKYGFGILHPKCHSDLEIITMVFFACPSRKLLKLQTLSR